ncbi:MAG: hypothetical protein IKP77_02200 [Acholeplasmatales bacterium]|nr:hypothetical protein [Acholeplasmatales bacterium]MBR6288541.1 hypothetical protein [Acholeplasmatales bacterium]
MYYDETTSDEIFTKYLNDMLSIIKKDYVSFSESFKAKKEICSESLFKVANDDSYLLSEVDYFSRHTILIYNAELVMSLFKLHNVEYFMIDGMENSYSPFYRIIGGKKVLFYFSFDYISSKEKIRIPEKYSFDKICIVRLVESCNAITDFEWKMSIKEIDNIPIDYVSIVDVMKEIDEESGYDKLIALFKLELRNYLGLLTIHISSKEKMNSFKSDIMKILDSYNFKEHLQNINNTDFDILKKNFSNNFLLLLGDSDYAKSFISSEWRYSLFATSEHFEQTSTVVGYIKSLEQFMFSYLMLKKDQGVTIKKNSYKTEYIEITTDRKISDYSIEFQPLVSALWHNKKLWHIGDDTLVIIKKILDDYKENIRNEHLHKDNIYAENEVDEIRVQTLVSFYLLLGGLKISEKEFQLLQPYNKIDDRISLNYNFIVIDL